MEMKFYRCRHCGNIITYSHASGMKVVCCGEEMQELVPNTTDAAQEKHVPVVLVEGNKVTVKVGSVPHPMTKEHYIEFIVLKTQYGEQRKYLMPDDAPEACFMLCGGDKVETAYEYCNLHGLWKS